MTNGREGKRFKAHSTTHDLALQCRVIYFDLFPFERCMLDSRTSSMENTTTIYYDCFPNSSGSVAVIVAFLALPFHIVLLKVLVKNVGLSLPHHKIMLSLIVSDAIQIFTASCVSSLRMALKLTTKSATCAFMRDAAVFTLSLTIVVSSLAVVTFAIERMIICIHFLKYRRLFKRKRITKILYGYWLFGATIAIIAAITNDARKTQTATIEATSFQIICVSIILPSATTIIIIYSRIFVFSRERIMQVAPSSDNSKLRTVAAFKKKQIRIALIASIVCIAYVVCMVPMSIAFLLELTGLIDNRPDIKKMLVSIAILNTLADPFIYGFGMMQTRQIFFRIARSIFPE